MTSLEKKKVKETLLKMIEDASGPAAVWEALSAQFDSCRK